MDGPQPSGSAGPAASPAPPSAARTASRSQREQPTPGGSVMQTPGSVMRGVSLQGGVPGTGLRGLAFSSQPTPASLRRPDLGGHYVGFRLPPNSAGRRTSLAPSDSVPLSSDAMDGEADQTYIWGTNLSVSRVQARFNAFVRTFKEAGTDDEPKYMRLLQETRARAEVSFNIDGQHMYEFDRTLYNWAVTYPAETVPIFDGQLAAISAELEGCDPEECQVQSRIYNLRETKVIRDLNPADINKLISVSGMVTRTSGVIPDQSLALFACTQCGQEEISWNDRGKVNEPSKCPNAACQAKFAMQMVYNRSAFLDKQLVKMQENPNEIPEGETPHTVSMFARQDLVDLAKPGDRITVTGVYRAMGVRTNPRLRELKAVYKTYIDVVHIQKDEASNMFSMFAAEETQESQEAPADASALAADAPDMQNPSALLHTSNMTREEMQARRAVFEELAADPDIYDRLAASVAPSIWQLDDVKKGILCQLFGGVSKKLPGAKTRGEINVLLVGDPGVSKSQLLSYVHKLAPRGIYTSGKGSSAVGLTAYVTKDPETREMVLESGALVLSDRGICCIDEFDKMSDSARSMLHEVMEQQTISVAKAGIIATLNARTSVLASANPVGSRYNPNLSVVDNIQLPPSLMSRFDLIYLLLDKANEATDRKLARHLISLYGNGVGRLGNEADVIPADTLRDFIAYARATCFPALTPEAANELSRQYVEMRSMGMSRKIVSATPRQLESLIRLSEALARMRLCNTVSVDDVGEAVRLMKVAMQQSSIDPRTGQIDMDVIQTGVSAADRSMKAQLVGELRSLLEARAGPNGLRIADLLDTVNAQASVRVSERDLRLALAQLDDVARVQQGVVTLRA
ncbi:DNA replication licensing factor MCM4 [Micractinium conductrix]|uniref:DNA replication licensing factor MCM4 n=1 Tax=Micractinium conductrix TaxID=554055 RepID=A0A2P6V1K8_9CHLO|nr:DNA replication licensing factor MCM4 [Micractinium conductrix]|eukprot:PSC67965.1 DNA replication licensing factor MCM4 [Micractinium conductrix]